MILTFKEKHKQKIVYREVKDNVTEYVNGSIFLNAFNLKRKFKITIMYIIAYKKVIAFLNIMFIKNFINTIYL